MDRLNWGSVLATLVPTIGSVLATYMSLVSQIAGIKEEIHLDASKFDHKIELLQLQESAHEKALIEIQSRMDGYEHWLKYEDKGKK